MDTKLRFSWITFNCHATCGAGLKTSCFLHVCPFMMFCSTLSQNEIPGPIDARMHTVDFANL